MLPDVIMQSAWLQYYVFAGLVFYPVCRIFARAGFPVWHMLGLFLPFVGLTFCAGLLALRPWPAVVAKKG